MSTRFPQVASSAPKGLPEGSILDGEIVALDASGRPSFALLAPLIQRAQPARRYDHRVTYVVFDVLRLGDKDVVELSYRERRRLLGELPAAGAGWVVADSFDDGAALFESTAARGLEGVVAKRLDSRYQPGVRSPDWRKIPHRCTRSLVIGGWKSRADSPGRLASLLVGTPTDDGKLRYEGAVGSGLSDVQSRTVLAVLRDIAAATSPFHGYPTPDAARGDVLSWAEPLLVVDVEHLGRTANALLRQPAVVRLRPDLSYADVVGGEGA